MAVAGPVAKPHPSVISTGNKHLAGWHANLAFNEVTSFTNRKVGLNEVIFLPYGDVTSQPKRRVYLRLTPCQMECLDEVSSLSDRKV